MQSSQETIRHRHKAYQEHKARAKARSAVITLVAGMHEGAMLIAPRMQIVPELFRESIQLMQASLFA
jgi:hypothetical protein